MGRAAKSGPLFKQRPAHCGSRGKLSRILVLINVCARKQLLWASERGAQVEDSASFESSGLGPPPPPPPLRVGPSLDLGASFSSGLVRAPAGSCARQPSAARQAEPKFKSQHSPSSACPSCACSGRRARRRDTS